MMNFLFLIKAYFTTVPLETMPNVQVPLHTLYRLRPKPYGADLTIYKYNPQTEWFDEIKQENG